MTEIDIVLDDSPVFVEIADVQLNVVTTPPAQVGVFIGGTLVYIDAPQPAPINVEMVTPPPIEMTVSLESGPPGPTGPAGPPGPRGSLFLGGYPSLANLPVPDGVDVKPGDFAFVQDTSTIYEVE